MKLRLIREPSEDGATIGSLYIDGRWQCWTLEDEIRKVKIPGQTAIPAGTYEVKLTMSPRFGRILPEILNVPNFIGIRIHGGNKKEDTEGCILPGEHRNTTSVGHSQRAMEALMQKLAMADTISITIENPR